MAAPPGGGLQQAGTYRCLGDRLFKLATGKPVASPNDLRCRRAGFRKIDDEQIAFLEQHRTLQEQPSLGDVVDQRFCGIPRGKHRDVETQEPPRSASLVSCLLKRAYLSNQRHRFASRWRKVRSRS